MPEKEVPTVLKFVFGGLSGCGAACFVQPMDLVKNRMQVNLKKLNFSFHKTYELSYYLNLIFIFHKILNVIKFTENY